MNFPSRGLRVSVTTTLKYGRFNAPSLRNLIATAILFFHSRHLRHHLFHFARVLHHLFHLIEATDQIVYLGDGRAAAASDPLTTPRVQNFGARPLLAGHRKHDGFRALELLLVNREALHVTHARQHAKHIFERAHFSEHFELGQEIVEIERRAAQFSFEALRVFDLDRFGRFFNQTDDVTHSENPAGQTLGYKRLELIELFTGADKFNRPLGHFAHGQGRAAARVAVELR